MVTQTQNSINWYETIALFKSIREDIRTLIHSYEEKEIMVKDIIGKVEEEAHENQG